MSPPFPYRPRLAEHALVRRHVVDGREIVVIHDTRTGSLLRMGPREWDLVAGADGTREIDGIALVAAQRGAYRRASEIRAILEQLHAAGLLADGVEHPPPPETTGLDRPLDVLSGFSLTCDASGVCCATYGSVLFSPREAARARAHLPDVLGGGDQADRVFLPEHGSAGGGDLAVAQIDGRCAYLAADGRCGIHVAAGEASKPRGCRVYPATFVDDGERVRVSIGVECPCVLASVGVDGGAPLVPPDARTRADLGPSARVAALPETLTVAADRASPRADFVAWSALVMDLARGLDAGADVVAILWSLGRAIDAEGLAPDAARRAFAEPARPGALELGPWLAALADRTAARLRSAAAWRSERDRSRRASEALAEGAAALGDPAILEAALASRDGAASEAFYLRVTIHGHHLVDEVPLADACRDRAVRLLLARALGPSIPADDPARAHPLTLVEAMMRGHGLKAYARDALTQRAAI